MEHDGQAEGDQNLVRMGAVVEVADQAALHQNTQGQHQRYGQQNRQRHRKADDLQPEVTPPDLQVGHIHHHLQAGDALVFDLGRQLEQHLHADRAKPADHEQRAMGKVDHAQRAENECEPQGNQRVRAALVQAVE